ncbi:MAG: Fic family protein [Chloroflexales bacterium]|nr:Fic family protein [Chloroflexales bacterium]
MNYLSKEDVLDLHAYVVTRYGGLLGIQSQDRLHTALNAPLQTMFGAELYPDVPSKAAAMTYLLVKSRPFLGGNEGTALIVLLRFLSVNGLGLRHDVGWADLFRLMRSLNHSDMDKEGLEGWLRENMIAAEPQHKEA